MKDKSKYLSPFPLLYEIFSRNDLTKAQIRVAARLTLYRNTKIGRCNPSQETIAKDLNITERTVRDTIKNLQKLNILIAVKPKKWKASFHYFFFYDLHILSDLITTKKQPYPELKKALEYYHSQAFTTENPTSGI
jgi:biotin operon repressor